jgi:hypothetical protein
VTNRKLDGVPFFWDDESNNKGCVMGKLNIELCPETGICSIVKGDGTKIDLMPDEVAGIRNITDPEAVKKALGEVDEAFAKSLDAKEIAQLSKELT